MGGTIYSGGRGAPIPGLCILVSSALLGTQGATQHSGTSLVGPGAPLPYPGREASSRADEIGPWKDALREIQMGMFNFGESRALHSLSPDMPLYGAVPE